MIGSHRQPDTPLLLYGQQLPDNGYHIDIAAQVVGFVEIAFGIPLGAA
jgi:hypothetical protein